MFENVFFRNSLDIMFALNIQLIGSAKSWITLIPHVGTFYIIGNELCWSSNHRCWCNNRRGRRWRRWGMLLLLWLVGWRQCCCRWYGVFCTPWVCWCSHCSSCSRSSRSGVVVRWRSHYIRSGWIGSHHGWGWWGRRVLWVLMVMASSPTS